MIEQVTILVDGRDLPICRALGRRWWKALNAAELRELRASVKLSASLSGPIT